MNKKSISVLLVFLMAVYSQNLKSQHSSEQNKSQSGIVLELKAQNISSGGGVISGGNYSVTSSIAQIDAGHNTSGGDYQFKGGFLNGSNDDLIFKNGFD